MTREDYVQAFTGAVRALYRDLGRTPTVAEIAERVGVSPRTVARWGGDDFAGTGPPAQAAARIVEGLNESL